MPALAFQLFHLFSFFFFSFFQFCSVFYQFPKRFLEEMPLRNHSAWLQPWLENERLLTDADSGPEKCVFWQMQVLVTKHCKYQCFLTKPAKSLTFSGLMENPLVGKKLKS